MSSFGWGEGIQPPKQQRPCQGYRPIHNALEQEYTQPLMLPFQFLPLSAKTDCARLEAIKAQMWLRLPKIGPRPDRPCV